MTMHVTERAHAKVNLNLTIHGRRPDGYHQLSSLVAFAEDVYDTVTVSLAPEFELTLGGNFGQPLEGQTNLIETAVRLARSLKPELQNGRFHLDKSIPVASGVGGGSADAAAALRAIAKLSGVEGVPPEFMELALRIGADVPVCLSGDGCRSAFMQGIGEQIFRPIGLPYLGDCGIHALLVNPGVKVATGQVFHRLGAPVLDHVSVPTPPEPFANQADLLSYLQATANDMERAAISIEPAIGEVLTYLETLPNCLLARMSGSGATCFVLFSSKDHSIEARKVLQKHREDWWVAPTALV